MVGLEERYLYAEALEAQRRGKIIARVVVGCRFLSASIPAVNAQFSKSGFSPVTAGTDPLLPHCICRHCSYF